MPLTSAPLVLDEPEGQLTFDLLSAHEIISIVASLSAPSLGILINRGTAADADHLEPVHFWRVPLRGSTVIIKRGLFSKSWSADFNNFGSREGTQFLAHLVDTLDAAIGRSREEIFRQLEYCDMHGCPLGHINWN